VQIAPDEMRERKITKENRGNRIGGSPWYDKRCHPSFLLLLPIPLPEASEHHDKSASLVKGKKKFGSSRNATLTFNTSISLPA
jgi:hypothetical protein